MEGWINVIFFCLGGKNVEGAIRLDGGGLNLKVWMGALCPVCWRVEILSLGDIFIYFVSRTILFFILKESVVVCCEICVEESEYW